MHSKYMVRDAAAVWMGSANFTSEAWSVQDNNIVIIESAELAGYYGTDFDDLWRTGRIAGTGKDDRGTVTVDAIAVDVDFSPGDGRTIDYQVAGAISAATHSVTIASMVISSGAVLNALVEAVERGVNVTGTYDGPQMAGVAKHWSGVSNASHGGASNGKAEKWQIVQSHLTGKKSMPFNPGKPGIPYNFMHNKVVVIDRQVVVTGSFNFSENATRNAENVIAIHDVAIAGQYDDYIAGLVTLFGG
jgi:phosphatidylserine/phosphatidylglycerophosphate/cardiolipin synthase-like enzyme